MSEQKVVVFEFGPEAKALMERMIKAAEAQPAAARPASTAGASGPVFRFGKGKGQPIAGANVRDLEWYGGQVWGSINDASKERFRADNERELAIVNAELVRQGQPTIGAAPAGPADDDIRL